MKYVIIAENDESQWDDKTGLSYNYPAKYKNILTPGTKVIYYKGRMTNSKYEEQRLSKDPHYFGVALIGDNYEDKNAKKKEYYCDILEYQPFDNAVPFKVNGMHIEPIPESKKTNYWRDGVRIIDEKTFNEILATAGMTYDSEYRSNISGISAQKFDEVLDKFNSFIEYESNGKQFLGFNEGYMHKRESYKSEIREQALSILDTQNWTKELIGKGEILKRIVESLELKGNNLVDTTLRYGASSLPHRAMIEAINSGGNKFEMEQVIYDLFKSRETPENLFKRFVELNGKKYSLIAFLFYLKNDREYLPISTSNFEFAFKILGSDLKLSQKCSWENYTSFLSEVRKVKEYLEAKLDENINYIDAHSFLWLIGYQDRYRKWLDKKNELEVVKKFEVISLNPVNNPKNEKKTRNAGKILNQNPNWEKIEKRKRLKGRKAEELVLEYEKIRLNKEDRVDLAEKVEDYSKKLGVGFDVLSWNSDGSKRCIEVKASSNNSFIITRNEVMKSKENPDYWIYIVNPKANGTIQIKTINGPELEDPEQFKLEPKDYYVSFQHIEK